MTIDNMTVYPKVSRLSQ